MQWLIDLVIEAIGIPPTFIDRGDPAAYDFTWSNHIFFPLTVNLDLSGIIPTNASAVLLRVFVTHTTIPNWITLRTKGNANLPTASILRIQVANVTVGYDAVVYPDTNRIIEMKVTGGMWILVSVTVAGWWL